MNAARLKMLRQARGLTLEQLSDAMGGLVTKQALSKYEREASEPTPRVLVALATALDVKSVELATSSATEVRILAFRKRAGFSKTAQRALESRVVLDLESRAHLQDLVGQHCMGDVPLGVFPVAALEDAEAAAEELRDRWHLGRDPLDNMVDVLEDHCVHVIGVDAPKEFDGISAVAEVGGVRVAAAVVVRNGVCRERQRLSLGHELGHLVVGPAPGVDDEKAAYRFGSALLAPRETLLREVGSHRTDITAAELLIVKRRFGMSLAALVYRLHDLGVLSDRYYQEWWRYIAVMGWRKAEPEETPAEEPSWLLQSALRAVSEGLLSEAHAQALLGRALPQQEGPSRRKLLATLPKEQRTALLAQQAAEAADFYADEAVDSDDELVEY